jgi:hypothetical protein
MQRLSSNGGWVDRFGLIFSAALVAILPVAAALVVLESI